jgi:hypothetical protein
MYIELSETWEKLKGVSKDVTPNKTGKKIGLIGTNMRN